MKQIPLDRLSSFFAQRKDIAFAVLFGSAQDGHLAEESDVDVGVCFLTRPTTEARLELMAAITDITDCDTIDLVDLLQAPPVLAFEAIRGRFLAKNDPARTAEVVSLMCRTYEDAMCQLNRVA